MPRLAGKDGPDSEPSEQHVDRSARDRALPRAVRTVLRHAARQDAAARLCADARGLRPLGARAEASRRTLSDAVAEGQTRFSRRTACVNCHTVAGTAATGRFGPDLTHLMSRDTIASGAVPNTPENLRRWIRNPDAIKPGSLMPAMHLNDHELDAVTAYLDDASLKPRRGESQRSCRTETVAARARRRRSLCVDRLHEWVTTVDHKRIGLMYIVYALIFLVIGGIGSDHHAHSAHSPA